MIGNQEAIQQFIGWLKGWKPGTKPVFLWGPPGVGKTLTVEVAARELGYELIELNASDVRTEEAIKRALGPASQYGTLFGHRGRLIFLDEVDGITGREDRGGLGAILELVNEARVPVVLAANDPWDPKLKPLRDACTMIRFDKPRPSQIVVLLRRICQAEGIKADERALKIIAELSEGDVRSAINDLQAVAQGRKVVTPEDVQWLRARNRQYGAFDVLRMLFTARTAREAKDVMNSSLVDYETLLLWIHENLPLQYEDPEELARAYDALSMADVYLGKAKKTQHWELLRYFFDLMTAGVALARRGKYRFVKYQFPKKLLLMAQTKRLRELREEAARLIAAKCHVSRRVAKTDIMPYLGIILDSPMGRLVADWLGLSDEMVKVLVKPSRGASSE
ncbi:replication factor C large subunit [Candidatus Geothermarchaeota archaeon ex4572_27]|nr:MAG: replication factor C large subunit [Candidatus Geothermarchaeota archaeon ex4572_27]